mmetsp:Transcript_15770/g.52769  ORF Transcript_15770/g.52769 Transcript_15770/m.52769 type:complete len:352 (-) Transcript_15770:1012-2067(-)
MDDVDKRIAIGRAHNCRMIILVLSTFHSELFPQTSISRARTCCPFALLWNSKGFITVITFPFNGLSHSLLSSWFARRVSRKTVRRTNDRNTSGPSAQVMSILPTNDILRVDVLHFIPLIAHDRNLVSCFRLTRRHHLPMLYRGERRANDWGAASTSIKLPILGASNDFISFQVVSIITSDLDDIWVLDGCRRADSAVKGSGILATRHRNADALLSEAAIFLTFRLSITFDFVSFIANNDDTVASSHSMYVVRVSRPRRYQHSTMLGICEGLARGLRLRRRQDCLKAISLLCIRVEVIHAVTPGIRPFLLRCVQRTEGDRARRRPLDVRPGHWHNVASSQQASCLHQVLTRR